MTLRAKIIWFASLLILYLLFWNWYGGNGYPITAEEGKLLMDRIYKTQSEKDYSEIKANFETAIPKDDGREFYMINLETEKPGSKAKTADLGYAKLVIPMLLKRGSFPVYVGTYYNTIIGSYGSGVTRVAIVRYRSLRDFLDMNSDPDMVKGAPFKFASLDHTEVFATKPIISAITIKFTLGVIFILLYWTGILFMNRKAT